ncbi:MAG TPA: hypothetical protein VFI61_02990 [Patescibacteria group bacterium]|nr:hypothetical protein [Patescibacteria group bacterium]
MKTIVLHGDDERKVYERLERFVETAKKRSWEVIFLDESNLSLQEVLSGTSLFETERFFILRDIKKLGKKEIDWLNKKTEGLSGNLIIYNEGIVGAILLKSLPKDTKVEEFKLPQLLWKFLDNMSVKGLHEIIKTEPIEFVFVMIAWKFKKKYLTSPTPKIKEIINKLAQIDVDVKTSKADLLSSLDLLFIKNLQ